MTHAKPARIAAPRTTALRWALPLVAASLAMTGCPEDEPPPTLFAEDGVWALVRYDQEGDGEEKIVQTERESAFLFNFTAASKVVQTAACIFPGTTADPEPRVLPGDTPCGRFDDDTEWECHCFGYAFEESQMRWVEFAAGDAPPSVSLEPGMMMADDAMGGSGSGSGGGDDGGGDDEGAAEGEATVNLTEVAGVGFTYNFRPLPKGVFGSNGVNSRFQMQARGRNTFAVVLDDPMRPSCEPCIP